MNPTPASAAVARVREALHLAGTLESTDIQVGIAAFLADAVEVVLNEVPAILSLVDDLAEALREEHYSHVRYRYWHDTERNNMSACLSKHLGEEPKCRSCAVLDKHGFQAEWDNPEDAKYDVEKDEGRMDLFTDERLADIWAQLDTMQPDDNADVSVDDVLYLFDKLRVKEQENRRLAARVERYQKDAKKLETWLLDVAKGRAADIGLYSSPAQREMVEDVVRLCRMAAKDVAALVPESEEK